LATKFSECPRPEDFDVARMWRPWARGKRLRLPRARIWSGRGFGPAGDGSLSESSECCPRADAFTTGTLSRRARSHRADTFTVRTPIPKNLQNAPPLRTLLQCGRFNGADAFTVRTLIPNRYHRRAQILDTPTSSRPPAAPGCRQIIKPIHVFM